MPHATACDNGDSAYKEVTLIKHMELATVNTYASDIEANIALGVLRTNGIECVLTGETVNTVMAIYNIGVDGIRLMVRQEDFEKAREILGLNNI